MTQYNPVGHELDAYVIVVLLKTLVNHDKLLIISEYHLALGLLVVERILLDDANFVLAICLLTAINVTF